MPTLSGGGPRTATFVRISAVSLIMAGIIGAGVPGLEGRAALVLAGVSGLIAPPGLGRDGRPGRAGMVALGLLAAAVLLMLLAVAG